MNRVSFSGDEKTIQAVWEWYECQQELSVKKKNQIMSEIRNNQDPTDKRFYGMTIEDINEFFDELKYLAMLDLLASVEAALRIDFLNRIYDRRRDNVSRQFRNLYNQKRDRVFSGNRHS